MLVLAIVASKRLKVHHMDVKSAFLHGDLEEEIYMKQPEGFIEEIIVWTQTSPKGMVLHDGCLPHLSEF